MRGDASRRRPTFFIFCMAGVHCGPMFCAAGSGGGAPARSARAPDERGAAGVLPLRFALRGLRADVLRGGGCRGAPARSARARDRRGVLPSPLCAAGPAGRYFARRGLPGDALRGAPFPRRCFQKNKSFHINKKGLILFGYWIILFMNTFIKNTAHACSRSDGEGKAPICLKK